MESFDILASALEMANQKGAFNLEQAKLAYVALLDTKEEILAIQAKIKSLEEQLKTE